MLVARGCHRSAFPSATLLYAFPVTTAAGEWRACLSNTRLAGSGLSESSLPVRTPGQAVGREQSTLSC